MPSLEMGRDQGRQGSGRKFGILQALKPNRSDGTATDSNASRRDSVLGDLIVLTMDECFAGFLFEIIARVSSNVDLRVGSIKETGRSDTENSAKWLQELTTGFRVRFQG